MKKKLLSFCMTMALLLSLGVVYVSASPIPSTALLARLTPTMSGVYSSNAIGTHKVFGAENYNTSKHSISISLQYFSAPNTWKTEKTRTVKVNTILNDTWSDLVLGAETSWRIYVRPSGLYSKDCDAQGYIWHAHN